MLYVSAFHIIQARTMGFQNRRLNKSFLAIIAIAIIATGSLAYFIASPSLNTQPNPSLKKAPKDGNLGEEVKKPVTNVTASSKPQMSIEANKPAADVARPKEKTSNPNSSRHWEELIIAENTKDPILYIRAVSELSGKGLGGMTVSARPMNSTSYPQQCYFQHLPNGSAVLHTNPPRVIFPNGTMIIYPECWQASSTYYTTNSTGYVAIPVVNAKFYSIEFGGGLLSPINPLWSATIPVQPNQSKVVTASVYYDPYTLDFTVALFREGDSTRWKIWNDSAGRTQSFAYDGPGGRYTYNHGPAISNITVRQGQTVRIMIYNFDAVASHSFVLPDFKILHLQGGMPLGSGRDAIFNANKAGKFKFYCTLPDEVANGILVKHSEEVGWLIVEP